MKNYEIKITRQAIKDIKTLSPKLIIKLKAILTETIAKTPYEGKRLLGELQDNYSFRLNLKDRVVYSIDEEQKTVFIKRARTHYGE